MARITAEQFWPRYRDEVRRTGSLQSLKSDSTWTPVVIQAARAVCKNAGLQTGNELYLDVMAYEQRESGVYFNWDLRVAFEHENGKTWFDELCKLCHVVADLRVLVAYFSKHESIQDVLKDRIDLMGDRIDRVLDSSWLFIFGPYDSRKNPMPWRTFTLGEQHKLLQLSDDNPFNPYSEFSNRF